VQVSSLETTGRVPGCSTNLVSITQKGHKVAHSVLVVHALLDRRDVQSLVKIGIQLVVFTNGVIEYTMQLVQIVNIDSHIRVVEEC
jgi:hypothetical protein